ncbi:MAG: glycerophosphodiester phosphodiesterase family protein [Candidatus Dormibacteria bacterium]
MVTRRQLPACGGVARAGADAPGAVRVVDGRFVDAAHRAGLCVDVWTVNSESAMHEALDLGVDGLMSDRLELLKRVLIERGEWENGAAMSSQPPGRR